MPVTIPPPCDNKTLHLRGILVPEVIFLKKKLPRSHSAHPATDAVKTRPVFGTPADCSDLINKYGTYNIQPTADSDNLFPMIAPGLPTQCRNFVFDKMDAERFEP